MEYWMDPPICFPQVHQFPSPSPVFSWFLTSYNPEGNSVWDFNSSKPRIPKFTSLEGAHPFHQERRRKLSPTPTPTFQLLQLTGQILIGNYNSINWGWWIIGSVRKALRQGRLVDGSRILLWSCGGRDNRKQLGFLRQRIGRGLAWNPPLFLIQGWLHPQKKTWGEILAAPGMRETGIRSGTRSIPESTWKTEPGSPGWKGKTRGCKGIPLFESLWGLDIRSKHLQDAGNLSKDTVQEFSKICSWVFRKPCLSSLPTLMGIPSSALRSWSRHGTIPKPGFGAPWHWPCHAPRIPLIPLPVDPHSPGSP